MVKSAALQKPSCHGNLSSCSSCPARLILSSALLNTVAVDLTAAPFSVSRAEYVTMVVTEFGMIPPSSVPVILREFSQSAQLE